MLLFLFGFASPPLRIISFFPCPVSCFEYEKVVNWVERSLQKAWLAF